MPLTRRSNSNMPQGGLIVRRDLFTSLSSLTDLGYHCPGGRARPPRPGLPLLQVSMATYRPVCAEAGQLPDIVEAAQVQLDPSPASSAWQRRPHPSLRPRVHLRVHSFGRPLHAIPQRDDIQRRPESE